MAVTVTFTDNFEEVAKLFDTAKSHALAIIGATVQEDAIKNSPKRTGALQRSWAVEVNDDESWVKIGVPEDALPVGKDGANYAGYVENGTSKMTGQHMLRNAVTENVQQFKEITSTEFQNVFESP